MLHKNIQPLERHAPHTWEYVDATERLAATGFGVNDIGKVAWQKDNNSFWVLTGYSPLSWASQDQVQSVFGRTGAVVAVAGDYTASQVTFSPVGNVAAVTVQAAIAELDTEKAAVSHLHAIGDVTGLGDALAGKVDENTAIVGGTATKITYDTKGLVTGGGSLVASDIPALDASKITTGTIDPARLPAYVDDVLEFANLAAFPVTGETGKIYVALDTNKTYRWSGSTYIYITSGAVDSVAGKTGVVTLVKGDVGLGNVDNTSDVNKPVSTATQTALNAKQDTLVSGTNIKTINGNSILGSGDLIVSSGYLTIIENSGSSALVQMASGKIVVTLNNSTTVDVPVL